MKIVEYVPINWGIVRAPANWFIVLLMVMIGMIAIHVIIDYVVSLQTLES